MKKIINNPNNVVGELLEGFAKANPALIYTPEYQVISRREPPNKKVGIVSGGGSGHEPAHAGYVGRGMLDAAVAGNVFSSPGPDRIQKGIELANAGEGVLLIVKNYSGDVMNFGMAQEIAQMDDLLVESVIVKDDVAVPDSTFSTGRRGIAGTVLVHKCAGAKAESGANLAQVKQVAEKAAANIRSMGMAMSSCIIPAVGTPGFTLEDNQVEIGMGIHGEPGIKRTTVKTAQEVAAILLDKILSDYDYTASQVAVLVNGLGSTPLMELYILYNEVEKQLHEKGISIYRSFVGNYMTALEMSGCSISLLKLDDELKELLDAPSDAPAFLVR